MDVRDKIVNVFSFLKEILEYLTNPSADRECGYFLKLDYLAINTAAMPRFLTKTSRATFTGSKLRYTLQS